MSKVFSITRKIQFAETDLAGVLHFSNYFRFMEEVEHAFWRSLGLSVYSPDGHDQISWPRVAVTCEYFSPLHFEDDVELNLEISDIKRKSMAYVVEFVRGGKKTALGKITAVCCMTSPGRFEAISIPDALRAKLQNAMELTV